MIDASKPRKGLKAYLTFTGVSLLLIIAVGAAVFFVLHFREMQNTVSLVFTSGESFPVVDEGRLSDKQKAIVQILKTEYSSQPAGTKYSEGANEPWCADFVSWVLRETGSQLKNPNSGSWRIPGTHTLMDYFVDKGIFHKYGDGYMPKTGDVAIYDGNGPFGQHTNFVVKYEQGNLYTVGGNEAGKIHSQVHAIDDNLKLVGFAEL